MGRTPDFPPRPSVVASSPSGEIDERVQQPARNDRDPRFAASTSGSEQGRQPGERQGNHDTNRGYESPTQAAIVAIAPAVLLAGFVWHPYTAVPDEATIAAAAAAGTTRWGLSHLTIAVGSGFTALAFLAIRSHLSEAGEQRWSVLALPCIVMGITLFAVLPGMEFAALAAAETGADVKAAQTALFPWFVSIL